MAPKGNGVVYVVVKELNPTHDYAPAVKELPIDDFLMSAPQLTYEHLLLGTKCLVSFRGTIIWLTDDNRTACVLYHDTFNYHHEYNDWCNYHYEFVLRMKCLKALVRPIYATIEDFVRAHPQIRLLQRMFST
mmetsp:Transcript_4649/g.7593  ORF Transcript_4649/g.7593 Transcript_4649/m.7593 type:complete len:132 (+) Transcript_4649:1507-1902(+)|eukprot:CAMPEP_0174969078 /NCGR_PEP_ID=MMETSP0004_2-20121128/8526_1 /TAXON_ID=420556 /ORGANISM="Ochromonas sp., Strain CCMP1393" /LENGTH=131 /DNA_ID=CAMNT_0016218455 /DNA_START=940 /DNA_END=1335 /DNA_ORIENTATION=-